MNCWEFCDVIVCPCCSSRGSRSPGDFTWEGHSIPLLVCNTCGVARLGRRLADDSLRSYYENYSVYYDHGEGSRKHRQIQGYRKFLEPFQRDQSAAPLTVLDVGCGFGEFLSTFSGWRKLGVELNSERAAYARSQYGIEVFEVDFLVLPLAAKSISLASAIAVLEHMTEPCLFLQKLSDVIADDGCIFLDVPDINHRHYGLTGQFSIDHVLYFTRETLRLFLESMGFTIKNAITYGVDLKTTGVLLNKTYKTGIIQQTIEDRQREGHALAEAVFQTLVEQLALITRTHEAISAKLHKFEIFSSLDAVAIYGAGDHTKLLMHHFPPLRNVRVFFDADTKKWNRCFLGGMVYPPQELARYKPKFLIFSSELHCRDMFQRASQYLDKTT